MKHAPFILGAICASCLLCAPLLATAKCPGETNLEQSTLESEVIVHGKVVALTPVGEKYWDAEIEVSKSYKGKYREEDTVMVRSPQGDLEVDFQVDQSVMVYASKGGEGKLETTRCLGSKSMKEAPLAAEMSSFFAVPPGKAPIEFKAKRASAIFVGEVTAAGRGFAGRWEGVMLKVKVKDSIKGAKRNATVRVRLDEDTCGGGKKRNLLSDDDMLAGDAKAPYEVKKQYLFMTYDEAPYQVLLCHDNMQPKAAAEEDIKLLKTMCKKKRCQSGHDDVGKLRLGVKQSVEKKAQSGLKQCSKELPLYTKSGAITDLELRIRVRPDGVTESERDKSGRIGPT